MLAELRLQMSVWDVGPFRFVWSQGLVVFQLQGLCLCWSVAPYDVSLWGFCRSERRILGNSVAGRLAGLLAASVDDLDGLSFSSLQTFALPRAPARGLQGFRDLHCSSVFGCWASRFQGRQSWGWSCFRACSPLVYISFLSSPLHSRVQFCSISCLVLT